MKRRKTKRLLAGLLALVMVLSLCEITLGQSTPAKAAVSLQNPTTDGNGVTTWDCIYFGNYYQSNSSTKEPIKWRVLSVNGNDAFLLADQNLDAKPYNEEDTDVTWATCTLRTWLNDAFLNTAFTSAEQAAIKNTTVVNDDNPYYGTEGGENTTIKCIFCPLQKQVIRLMDLMASLIPAVIQEKQKIQHMQKSAERGRHTRGTAVGGCGRRATIVVVHPMCIAVATAMTLVVLSTLMVMRFGPLCI